MGRFAGLSIALGFGAAVFCGHGLARAEPSDSSSDHSSGTSTNSPTAASTNVPSRSSTSTGAQTSNAPSALVSTGHSNSSTPSTAPSNTAPTTSKDRTSPNSPATAPLLQPSSKSHPDTNAAMHLTPNSALTSSAATNESTAVRKVGHAKLSPPTAHMPSVAPSSTTTISGGSLASVSAAEPIAPRTDSSQVAAAPPAGPFAVIAGVVSNVLAGLLHPLATGGAPETPFGAPAVWSLLAFARREFETALAPASVADVSAAAQTTTQTSVTGTPVAGLQAQAAVNSLTYTPPPTIIDQLTVASLRLVRDITGLFGIPYTVILSKLITSGNPPFFLTQGLTAQKTDFEVSPGDVWKVWEFTPPNPTGATVIAIHGGGAVFQPNILHWIDYTQMARQTGATVLVPLYPLATTEAGSLLNVTPGMADYISQVIDDHGAQNVSVYADSEGATYAFAAVRDLILAGKDVPASMVLMSGQADYSTENTGAGVDDPFFNKVTIDYFTRFHTFDGVVDKDPRISPLRMETAVLQAMPPTTMYVGTDEMLWPANLMLYQRAVDIGAPISLVVGLGQYHDWPLGGLPVNSAAPLVRRDIYRQLGLLPTP